jgi:hypothetical protein
MVNDSAGLKALYLNGRNGPRYKTAAAATGNRKNAAPPFGSAMGGAAKMTLFANSAGGG